MNDDSISPPATFQPQGIRRADSSGVPIIDALAGVASVFGFGFAPLTAAVQAAAEGFLGNESVLPDDSHGDRQPVNDDDELSRLIQAVLAGDSNPPTDSLCLCASADLAIEQAIQLARSWQSPSRFRTVAMVGSDHGRTIACRTASGRPELHENLGPLVAGFAHVPVGDIGALKATVDEQTAAVLLSPIDLLAGARTIDADYLIAVREVCDQQGLLLITDESRLCFGTSGQPLAVSSIADIPVDAVVLSGGLFGGMAGGLLIASEKMTGNEIIDLDRHPLQAAALRATLQTMQAQGLPTAITDAAQEFAVSLAEKVGDFEFVRDVHVCGRTIGIETDLTATEIVAAAAKRGLLIATAGQSNIRLQLPLVVDDDDCCDLLDRLTESMESIERETADLSA